MTLPTLRAKFVAGFFLLLPVLLTPVRACVGCREPGTLTLENENPTVLAGMAFSWSVLFMLAFVLLIVFGMSFYIWRTCRALDQKHDRQ